MSSSESTIIVYDASGKQIAEYSTVVANSTDAKVNYLTADHLGSPRIDIDANGTITARHDYHPFGEEISTAQRTTGLKYLTSGDSIRKQFTGYERDTESNLDYTEDRGQACDIAILLIWCVSYGTETTDRDRGRFVSCDSTR